MRSRVRVLGAGVVVAFSIAVPAASAGAPVDYADTALNIIPSGQYGSISPPPGADDQARHVRRAHAALRQRHRRDLTTYFKSEALGSLGTDGPGTVETVPARRRHDHSRQLQRPARRGRHRGRRRLGSRLDRTPKDRGLLLQQARYNARVAAIDVPGLSAIDLISHAPELPAERRRPRRSSPSRRRLLQHRAPRARPSSTTSTPSSRASTPTSTESAPTTQRWTRNDVFALNALKSQFLGQGGGDEARRSQFLGGLQDRLGDEEGLSVFNDLRQFKNPESADDDRRRVQLREHPEEGQPRAASSSTRLLRAVDVTPDSRRLRRAPGIAIRRQASNTLMITAEESATGNPLMVGGPQIGYFYPGLTYEMDMDAGDLQWRGATSAPFPGYLLIGRGEDFATTLTSASADVIDQYAETLCGGSDTKYMYKGKCLDDGDRSRRGRSTASRSRSRPPCTARSSATRPSTASGSRSRASAPATARTRRPPLQPPDLERLG